MAQRASTDRSDALDRPGTGARSGAASPSAARSGGRRLTHGDLRREAILDRAVDFATAQGLEGLSIGRLAAAAEMSKSGLFAHFGSKEELQLATVARAAEDFERRVVAPSRRDEPGRARLVAMLRCWIDHIESIPYRGGCFFQSSSTEFAGRPGRVQEEIAGLTRSWLEALVSEARLAGRLGELSSDPEQLAFELHAFVQEANWAREVLGDTHAFDRARRAVESAVGRASGEST